MAAAMCPGMSPWVAIEPLSGVPAWTNAGRMAPRRGHWAVGVHLPDMGNRALAEAFDPETIVGRAVGGDERAFAMLVDAHHASMLRVAFVITGDADVAADAAQAAWSIAWRRLGSIRDRSAVGSWLVAIAANEARLLGRRQRRRTVVELAVEPESRVPDPGNRIAVVDLQRALQRLAPDDRMLLALRYVADLDSSEIAGHLHLSASGVRSRLSRLLERLRLELDRA
jgi:RNA polymerase sigma-70 factor (ECF subfamily)